MSVIVPCASATCGGLKSERAGRRADPSEGPRRRRREPVRARGRSAPAPRRPARGTAAAADADRPGTPDRIASSRSRVGNPASSSSPPRAPPRHTSHARRRRGPEPDPARAGRAPAACPRRGGRRASTAARGRRPGSTTWRCRRARALRRRRRRRLLVCGCACALPWEGVLACSRQVRLAGLRATLAAARPYRAVHSLGGPTGVATGKCGAALRF